jgi:hypothetical protein
MITKGERAIDTGSPACSLAHACAAAERLQVS